ncbi:MAG: ribonuclease H-like domain-containing protein [Lachnospiraceae bacterium]|nr:ribonuclease H-like domain-containing protein [Lachnospiraceae bacterium]
MEIIKNVLQNKEIKYPLENVGKIEDLLFLDIETTGFSSKMSKLYLIGCVYYKNEVWNTIQFFANEYSDEKELLEEFFEFAKPYKTLIHFNGNNFDIPYLLDKCKEFNLDRNFDSYEGIDIYKRIQPLKSFLKLINCKQKTIEGFLGINREDKFSGGDLIGVYHDYVSDKDEQKKGLLLLHNFDDICGILDILPILYYCDLFKSKLIVTKVSAGTYKDINGNDKLELLMDFDIPFNLPVPVASRNGNIYFTASNAEGVFRVPIFEGELKYFFANYKEYYYLPIEDMALHKSVASFVDKSRREQAKASNCYIKKTSRFLPEFDNVINPFFKSDYSSKELYWEITEERKTDRNLFSAYSSHLMANLL